MQSTFTINGLSYHNWKTCCIVCAKYDWEMWGLDGGLADEVAKYAARELKGFNGYVGNITRSIIDQWE